jgi:hypothetical protein
MADTRALTPNAGVSITAELTIARDDTQSSRRR